MLINIEDVFLPRGDFNTRNTYISRRRYEEELKNCLQVRTNIFISGESGTGKTWLYEIFFNKEAINFVTINLAEVSMYDSLFYLLEKNILENISGKRKDEILESCYDKITKNNSKPSYIVFDNLEHLADDILKRELISLLHNLDNSSYSKYNVRIMLVGIPNSLKDFFANMNILFEPIANRIREIPKLNGFEKSELLNFLDQTLIGKLLLNLTKTNLEDIFNYIASVTDLIPLRVQQYLLYLSKEIFDNNKVFSKELFSKASKKWIQSHYSELEITFDEYFLPLTGKIQKRNQLIFLLGKISKDSLFTNKQLSDMYSKHFPNSVKSSINISQILAALMKGNQPLIVKMSKDKYRLRDSRMRILINSKLAIDSKEIVYSDG
ncbi:ATP-binding protein [Aliarcobacter butzleri]|uniref:ATP-binding protein n=1 Tax=Aliarcobacter butzleri TaxID=28197 RepID=UPI00125EF6D3|nr:ATP-binding protein [Aliarcobacter butzleri]